MALALLALIRSLLSLCHRCRGETNDDEHECKRARTRCVPIDDPAYKRPDPLVYAQYFQMDHGLNLTWDNPDFAIETDRHLVFWGPGFSTGVDACLAPKGV